MIFYCRFELPEAFTTRIHQKNVQKPSKKAKKTAAGTNILPQKSKSPIIPPPATGNLPFIHGCPDPSFEWVKLPHRYKIGSINFPPVRGYLRLPMLLSSTCISYFMHLAAFKFKVQVELKKKNQTSRGFVKIGYGVVP